MTGKAWNYQEASRLFSPQEQSALPLSSGFALDSCNLVPHAGSALTYPRGWVLGSLDSKSPLTKVNCTLHIHFSSEVPASGSFPFPSCCRKSPLDLSCKRFTGLSFSNITKCSHLARGHPSAPVLPASLRATGSSGTRHRPREG